MDLMSTAQLLGNLGEFVGAIAVVITLLYLVRQVHQSTNVSQAETTFAYFESVTRVHERMTDATFNQLLRKAIASWGDLDADEKMQMHGFFADWANKLHMGYLLMRRGVLDEDSYSPWEGAFVSFVKTPGIGAWWQETFFPDDFTQRINKRTSDKATLAITDRLSFLQSG